MYDMISKIYHTFEVPGLTFSKHARPSKFNHIIINQIYHTFEVPVPYLISIRWGPGASEWMIAHKMYHTFEVPGVTFQSYTSCLSGTWVCFCTSQGMILIQIFCWRPWAFSNRMRPRHFNVWWSLKYAVQSEVLSPTVLINVIPRSSKRKILNNTYVILLMYSLPTC